MNFKEIQNDIDKKKDELLELNNKLDEAGKAKYKYLVGKYYELASNCKIKVIDVCSVDERCNTINIECIRVQGGKHDNGKIEVDINGDYDLRFVDIDKKYITEITQSQFNIFLMEAIEETRKILINPQIGCGYCKYEKTCPDRDIFVNKAKLGCKRFIHHEEK